MSALVLYDAGPDKVCGTADDQALANTTTDANGKYRFDMVPTGTYCVKVLDATLPAGLKLVSGANPHGPITLAEGQVYKDADFGYQVDPLKAAIGDQVWSDANGNGVQDPGEIGIGNVTLDLIKAGADGKCDAADATVVATTTTAGDGSYLFTGLAPGVYCVKVTDKNNVLTGQTLTGGTNPAGPITLVAGQTYLDADFGYKGSAGQIGDLVFYDANRNGVYEPGQGRTRDRRRHVELADPRNRWQVQCRRRHDHHCARWQLHVHRAARRQVSGRRDRSQRPAAGLHPDLRPA